MQWLFTSKCCFEQVVSVHNIRYFLFVRTLSSDDDEYRKYSELKRLLSLCMAIISAIFCARKLTWDTYVISINTQLSTVLNTNIQNLMFHDFTKYFWWNKNKNLKTIMTHIMPFQIIWRKNYSKCQSLIPHNLHKVLVYFIIIQIFFTIYT